MVKFASNANTSATTRNLLFLASQRYIPHMIVDLVDLIYILTSERIANANAKSISDCMQEVWKFTRTKMAKSQQAQIQGANKHKKSSLKYKVGDRIWLSTKNIHTERPSKKLDHKRINPYKITKLVGLSYQLELSISMHIHNMFHLSLLKLAAKDLLLDQINDLPPPVVVNDKKKQKIDNILNAKRHGRYKVLF